MNLSFEPAFTYIVLGYSGSGKTTLVNHLFKTIFIPVFKKMSPIIKYSEYFQDYRDKIENNKKGEHFLMNMNQTLYKKL